MLRFETARAAFYKLSVLAYRLVAAVVLFSALTGVFSYGILYAFYAVNTSWVAPIIISPSNDTILQMTSQLVSSTQTLDVLVLDRNRLQDSLGDMKSQCIALQTLDRELTSAVVRLRVSNTVSGKDLVGLTEDKKLDIVHTHEILKQVEIVSQQIEEDLAAGLITKGDAAIQRTAIVGFRNNYTDIKVGEVLLRDSVRSKTTLDVDTLAVLAKQADLRAEIIQLNVNITIGDQQLQSDKDQIASINHAIDVVKQSPFYQVTQSAGKLGFAFVPYDNEGGVKVGTPVFDCYLNMIVCRQVGTVSRVFTDEQHAMHPIFKTDIRGTFVQLALTNQRSAKSKTLFIGGKPLGI
jgi:hypothetical protein